MVSFNNVTQMLESYGLSDVLIPFVLIFTITFAVLQRAHIFGKGDETKGYNIVVATILALTVVIPHVLGRYPAGRDVVVIINQSLPNIAVLLIAIVAVFLIIGLFGGSQAWPNKLSGFIAFAAFLIVGYIFGKSAGWFGDMFRMDRFISPDTQALLIVIGVFALIVWFITRDPSQNKKGFGDYASDFFNAVGSIADAGKGGKKD